MKTKIVFSGVMAAILAASSGHAAVNIASQKYVDEKVGGVEASVTEITNIINGQGGADSGLDGGAIKDGTITSDKLDSSVLNGYLTKGEASSTYRTADQVTGAITSALTAYETAEAAGAKYQTIANKTDDIATNSTSTTLYPSAKGVADYVTAQGFVTSDSIGSAITDAVDEKLGTDGEGLLGQIQDALGTVGDLEDLVGGYEDRISGLEGDVEDLQGDVEQAQTDIGQAKTDITGLQGRMTTAEGNIEDLQGDVEDLQGDVTKAKTDISGLQGDVTKAKTDITGLQAVIPAAGPECSANLCVLSSDGDSYTWVPVTDPLQ